MLYALVCPACLLYTKYCMSQCHRSQQSTGSQAGIVRQLNASSPPPPPERCLLGNFKQPEPPLPARILFSGLLTIARAILAPTPALGFPGRGGSRGGDHARGGLFKRGGGGQARP